MNDPWFEFGRRVLSARLAHSGRPAVELLIAGTVLGPATMLDLIRLHHDHIDAQLGGLDEVLVPGLARITDDSGALLLRLLGRHADSATVDALQAEMMNGRAEHAALVAEAADEATFAGLFEALVTSGGVGGQ